ncbi:hypothetical protein EJB05_16359 [Eragrostis curvula]|uniref:Amino acid permease/ SLC12A domain-containing protein n=1 Tax=Eragrostis curvula TaxID=38414 RepID=A0A5J9VGK9_9POAL|nr:hypothetical protein EJB05_16359 [Eragrostis curvula]
MDGQLQDYRPLAGDDEVVVAAAIRDGAEGDDVKLRLLGYKQQLKRDLSVVSNFAVTFSIVSVMTGVTTLFGMGLQFGGPVTMVWGWPIAGAFTLIVGLAMAEICSAYPTSGGLYFWSARLCSRQSWGPFAAWLTGCWQILCRSRKLTNPSHISRDPTATFELTAPASSRPRPPYFSLPPPPRLHSIPSSTRAPPLLLLCRPLSCLATASSSDSKNTYAMTWNKSPSDDGARTAVSVDVAGGSDDTGLARLRELGYKQELKRDLSVLSNFAFSFSIISVLTGVTTLYNTGLTFGGPATITYGWFVAGAFTMTVGLSMAEICSSFPTSGGLYYWSARLSGRCWAPFASWITGWYVAVAVAPSYIHSCRIDRPVFFVFLERPPRFCSAFVYLCCLGVTIETQRAGERPHVNRLIQVIILLSTGGNNGGGYVASKYVVIAFHAAILLSHAVINSLSITWLSFLGQFAAAWNMLGVFVLMIAVPTVATERASAKFVFTHFNTENNAGIHSNFYIFVLGLLMSQYTLTGYDASAHMTEETKNADRNGPIGIISAIGISILVGWGYILGITFAVKDIPYLLSPDNDAGGYAIAEVFYLAFKSRYGNGVGGIVCLGIVAVAIYFCGMSSVTSNSRMAYAFSRDGAMPFSSVWHKVNKQEVPINAVWLSAFIAFCMALTSLGSLVAFQAMVSIATIGLYISYALPILFRVTLARKHFVPGPFNLGRYGVLVGSVAVLWVATITVLFSLPVTYPVTKDTLNYTPVAVGGLFFIVLSSWLFSARHWFKGPVTNLDG